jgi:pentatricopeptide repeat protein
MQHQLTLCAHHTMWQVCGRAGQWSRVLSLLDAIHALVPSLLYATPTYSVRIIHHAIWQVCGRAGQWSRVLSLLDAMHAQGLRAGEGLLLEVMQRLGKAGR